MKARHPLPRIITSLDSYKYVLMAYIFFFFANQQEVNSSVFT